MARVLPRFTCVKSWASPSLISSSVEVLAWLFPGLALAHLPMILLFLEVFSFVTGTPLPALLIVPLPCTRVAEPAFSECPSPPNHARGLLLPEALLRTRASWLGNSTVRPYKPW